MSIRTIKLAISGMTCEHCARTIEKTLDKLAGIQETKIAYPQNEGLITFDSAAISKEEIIAAVNSIGQYQAKEEKSDNLSSEYDLIIIGGGSAAFSAAIKASELDKKVLMINDGLPIGGTCVNVGCVPSKTLIRTAEAFHLANHPNFNGIKAGENRIDFKQVIAQKKELVEELRQKKYVNLIGNDLNVSVLKGRAKLCDKSTVEVNAQRYKAGTILIASGSSSFIPDIPGLANVGYFTNDTLYELAELPEHLIVIGGRYIALENAQLFARLGSRVTILQRSPRILPTEMPDITETLSDYLRAENIDIRTGVKIHAVSKVKSEIKIQATVKDKEEIIKGTHLFVAAGRKGNTKDLGLEELGVETYGNGFIKTDEFQRTTIRNIYAAGDVTGEHLYVYTAAYAGALAVENAFGEQQKGKDYSILPWVIFTDPQVAGVGLDEKQAAEAEINFDVSVLPLNDVPRSLAARNTKGFIKLIRNKETDKLIGARILASEGSELLMEIALAIKYGIPIKELKQIFHPYLTLAEGVKLAAIAFDKDVSKLSCCAV